MRSKAGRLLTATCGGFLLTAFLTGCGPKNVVVSGDLSCSQFRHIPANDKQRAAMKADWDLWESLAIDVAAHNTQYAKACLSPREGP